MHRTVSIACKVVSCLLVVCYFANAQDSREGDSLALVAIYDANGGLDWNLAEPINTWSGISAGSNPTDRATMIMIQNKNMGTIPAEIGNLTKMESLILTNNLIGEIPSEIVTCAELIEIDFEKNSLTTIPAEIGSLAKLINLRLLENVIESLPTEIGNLSKLMELYLDNNNLTSIPTEMGNLSKLSLVTLDNNSLHFDDIELMKGFVDECYYNPQDTLGTAFTDTLDTLSSPIKIGVAIGGSMNHYAWTKDGDSTGEDSDSITVSEAGVYVCNITSDSITDLTLTHWPITVVLPTPIIVQNINIPQYNFSVLSNKSTQKAIIHYQLPALSHVELTIYDITGQKVSTLVSQQQTSGSYRYEWNTHGRASGAYFCQLTAGHSVQVRKFILIE